MCVCTCLQVGEVAVRSTGAGVTGDWESPDVGLGAVLGSSARAGHTLKHGGISPAPSVSIFRWLVCVSIQIRIHI